MRKRLGLAGIGLFLAATSVQAAPRGEVVPRVAPQWQQDIEVASCEPVYGGYAVEALAGIGALVRMDKRLVAFTPQGDVRWQQSAPCDQPRTPSWEKAIPTPDGGAWAVSVGPGYGGGLLQRLDGQGQVGASIELEFDLFSGVRVLSLSGDDETAVVVNVADDEIEWRRYDRASGILDAVDNPLEDTLYRRTYEARPLADGGVGIAFGEDYCDLAVCPPVVLVYLLAPLDRDGNLRWHVAGSAGIPLFDPQGGADIVGVDYYNEEGPRFLRRVTPDGEVAPDIALTGITGRLISAHGPHAGHELIVTSEIEGEMLWSIDRAGNVLASHALEHRIAVLDESARGLLAWQSAGDPACMLRIDPLSLRVTACFRLEESAEPYSVPNASRLLDDGSLYASFAVPANGDDARIVLARFDAPATAYDAASRRHRAYSGRAMLGAPSLRPAVPGTAGRPVE
jgi:hypothetical protein